MIRSLLVVVALVLVLFGVANIAYVEYRQPIAKVEVHGEHYFISRTELRELIESHLVNETYWSVSLSGLSEVIERDSWIAKATVSRNSDNVIEIHIREEQPLARWNDKQLVGQAGNLYDSKGKGGSVEIPQLKGPDGLFDQLMSEYQLFNDVFRSKGVSIINLVASDDGQRYLRLNTGVDIMLGSNNIEDNILRFNVLWNTLSKEQRQNMTRVDMRYDNAAAITWRKINKIN